MEASTRNALVPVASGYGIPETQVALSYLRAYGIDAIAQPIHLASVAWHLMHALGGIQIHVPRHQESAALALLDDVPQENGARRHYSQRVWLNAAIAVAVWLLCSVPPPAQGFVPIASRRDGGDRPETLHPRKKPV